MPIFFTIHNLSWGVKLSNAQRNCRTFIYGICIYICIFLIIKNLHVNGYLHELYDAIFSSLMILFMADIAVMAYIYRQYFGRNIIHELPKDEDNRWKYDTDTHQYQKITPEEQLHEREIRAKKEATRLIRMEKRRIRAAKTIQRWWREVLYKPPNGLFYLKSKRHFEHTILAR